MGVALGALGTTFLTWLAGCARGPGGAGRAFFPHGTGRAGRGRCGFHRFDHVVFALCAWSHWLTLGTRGALAAPATTLAPFCRCAAFGCCATFAPTTAAAGTLFLGTGLGGRQVDERRAKPVDLAADQLFDVVNRALVGARDDRVGDAAAARAAGAADTVDIIFRMGRDVEVENVADVWNIETACGHIRADEQVDRPVLEGVE